MKLKSQTCICCVSPGDSAESHVCHRYMSVEQLSGGTTADELPCLQDALGRREQIKLCFIFCQFIISNNQHNQQLARDRIRHKVQPVTKQVVNDILIPAGATCTVCGRRNLRPKYSVPEQLQRS